MVKNRGLLLIAGIVWLIAGVNIVRIGIEAYAQNVSIFRLVCSALVYIVFWLMFQKLVVKHTVRIRQYVTEKQYFWKFFDLKSFCIMAFMMTLGIGIRTFGLMPDICIAVFYTGLGLALVSAGIKFSVNYVQYNRQGDV